MKKLMAGAVALVLASSAMAQLLPVAQTAAKTEVGAISATAGVSIGTGDLDVKVVGARCSYGVIENLLIVGDVGLSILPNDNKVGIGVAAQYTLPVELPVDVAVRLGVGTYSVSDFSDIGFVDALLMASSKIEAVDGLAVYGGAGISYPLNSDANVAVMGDVGATYGLGAVVQNLSIFGELTYATEHIGLGVSAGAVYAF